MFNCSINLTSIFFVILVGEQDGKVDDAQSSMSGACEEYEPISDDELDEILNDDAGKREENQDEEKVSGNLIKHRHCFYKIGFVLCILQFSTINILHG